MSDRSRTGRMRASKAEMLAEPLSRALDLLRALDAALASGKVVNRKPVDTAVRACEQLMRALPGVESDRGRRAFTRELHRAWANILEVQELLTESELLRVFVEIEGAFETARRLIRRFDEISRN